MTQGTVLVTGVSGFIATHVTLNLLEAGYDVRGSVRSLSKTDAVKKTLGDAGADLSRVEFCALDLMKDDGWEEAMAGVDFLCHCASPFVAEEPADPMELIGPAVEGTRRALEAALRADVKRIVLTSSFAAIGYGPNPSSTPYDESAWTETGHSGAYVDSKTLAERKAWEIMEAAGRENDLTVINPTLVLGPALNADMSTSIEIVARMMRGEFPVAPKIFIPIVDIRDVAALHVRGFDDDLRGKRVLAGDKTMSMLDIAKAVLAEDPERRKVPKSEAPNFMVRIMSLFDKQARGIVKELGIVRRVNSAKAREALGRDLISSEDATRAAARSLIDLGIV